MHPDYVERYRRTPSPLVFMPRVVRPYAGLGPGGAFPSVVTSWSGARFDERQIGRFRSATGLEPSSILFPHAFAFRLVMATLTHRAFPLPIWNALQVRNRLVAHRPLDLGGAYDFETRVVGHRTLDKGVEVDLATTARRGGDVDWESVVSVYYRGRFPGPTTVAPASPDLAGASEVATFRMPGGGGWSFGGLTGDFNGVHLWRGYARRFGFSDAFLHPQNAVGRCLARLPAPASAAQRLDLWIKGPVFYQADVTLSAVRRGETTDFGLRIVGDPRFALAGTWSAE